MVITLLQIHIACALAVCAFNTYWQLVLSDNWPPTSWRRISWDAIAILLTVSLFAWPLVLVLMWLDRDTYRRTGARQHITEKQR